MKKIQKIPDEIPSRIIVTDTLDLHGFFPEKIEEIIDAFIQNGLDLKLTRLRIIHGKGKSRLKFEVHQALKANPHVVNFHDAPVDLGGWGATVVEISSDSR
jgi:dsDNA-specific endonuclease/ATPase MutS2